jgi:hypothetical protein
LDTAAGEACDAGSASGTDCDSSCQVVLK